MDSVATQLTCCLIFNNHTIINNVSLQEFAEDVDKSLKLTFLAHNTADAGVYLKQCDGISTRTAPHIHFLH